MHLVHLMHLVDMAVFGHELDSMISGFSSKLIDSVIQWLDPQMGHRIANDLHANF